MTDLTDFGENAAVSHLLGTGNFFVALHSADPGEQGLVGEITGDGVDREQTSFTVTGDTAASDSELVFGPATADKGTATHFSIWNAVSGGDCIAKSALDVSRAWPSGTLTIAAGGATLSLD